MSVQELTKRKHKVAIMNAVHDLPVLVARDRGFFTKYGVTADTIFVRGAPTLVAAMQANEIDVGYTGGTAVVGAVANGADLKVLSAFTNRVTYDLMVRPGIKTPEDLRGKKFGIQSIGGTVWMVTVIGHGLRFGCGRFGGGVGCGTAGLAATGTATAAAAIAGAVQGSVTVSATAAARSINSAQ